MSPFPEALVVPVGLCATLVLYFGPGYLVARALRFPRTWACCIAPLASWAFVSVLCEVYARLGVFASYPSVVVPLLLLAGACCVVSRLLGARVQPSSASHARPEPAAPLWRRALGGDQDLALPNLPAWSLLVAALLGAGLGYLLFVEPIGGMGSFFPGGDNYIHTAMVRAFADSGQMSSLSSSVYRTALDSPIDPWASYSFYPAGWSSAAALIAQTIGQNVAVAANLVTYVSIGVVYPLSATALAAALFADDRRSIAVAGLAALSFAAYPWLMLTFGLLAPNLSANALVLCECLAFILFAGDHLRGRARLAPLLFFVLGGVAIGLLQPNGIFSCAVFLVPFCVARAWAWKHEGIPGGKLLNVVACAVVIGAFCAAWVALYRLPAFAYVVGVDFWHPFTGRAGALVNVFSLAYLNGFEYAGPQWVLSALLCLGAVRCVVQRRNIWLVCSYALAAGLVFVSNCVHGELRQLLAGFWYVDFYRLAALAAICGAPLAAFGLSWVGEGLAALLARDGEDTRARQGVATALWVALLLAFAAQNFYGAYPLPGQDIDASEGLRQTAFGNVRWRMRSLYRDNNVYTPEERAFVNEVKQVVDGDALIANDPFDGSISAYSIDGLRVYERYVVGYGSEQELADSALVRERLANIANDPEVAAAAQRLGIRYVLRLYEDPGSSSWFWGINEAPLFDGVNVIGDDTPGFHVVLAEGPYRLYELDAA